MNNNDDKYIMNKPPRKWISRIRTIPVFLPAIIAICFLIFGIWVQRGDLSRESTFGNLCLLLFYFLLSLSGVLVIIRKEVPRLGLPSIKGWVAVVEGFFLVIVTTTAMIMVLIELIK